ncbi:hypothetical protein DFH06DRAFT_309713 [Mycena polygramma]|nr:hypothetical protein DFH06DRAFT_309713 [Mycena polygramma]
MFIDANNQAHIDVQPLSDCENEVLPQPLPPIHNLPVELLAEIMALSLTPYIGEEGLEISPKATDLLALCQVCSFWRQVASNTPRLWLVQTFPLMTSTRKDCAMSSIWTEIFLDRSAPLLISVSIYPSMYFQRCIELPPMVISAARRWKTSEMVYDTVTGKFDAVALAQIQPGSLINLENLTLKWHNPEVWQGPKLDVFLSAPRLRNVTLEVPHLTNIPPMPWDQLTHLSLRYDAPQVCLDLLVQCRNIVSAEINTEQWRESDSPPHTALAGGITLAHLEEVDIRIRICSTGEHLGPFLRRLRPRSLSSLTLTLQVCDDDEYFISWIAPALVSFLSQAPGVECLQLDNLVFEEMEDIRDILQLTPNLTTFDFSNWPIDDDFFAFLRVSELDGAPLVPKLETLSLGGVGINFEETSFASMMRSRWWSDDEWLALPAPPPVARLKCLKFWDHDVEMGMAPFFSQEVMDTMGLYQSQGLLLTDCNCF